MWFWSKAWITAWVIFGSQALTWEWPLSLFNKLMTGGLSMDELKNKFGNVVGGLGTAGAASATWAETGDVAWSGWWVEWWEESVSESVVPAMYSMMIFNSSTKVSDISEMTTKFKDNNDNRKIFYEESCKKLEKEYGSSAAEHFQNTFSDQFDETRWNERLAWFGVVLWTTDANESVYWLANNATMNKIILEKFKADNWLKENGNEQLKAYKKTKKENNEPIDVDDLNEHMSEWFDVNVKATHTQRPEDIDNKKTLVTKVETSSLDASKKQIVKEAIQDFYDERTIGNKPDLSNFSIETDNDLLVIKSQNWNKTKIDMNTNTLKSSGVEINFPTLSEAINAADLTNYILNITKWKVPKDLPPFEYQLTKKAICFNDAVTRSLETDTRIKTINRFMDRSHIDKNASTYAKYLSERRKEINKLNLTKYPLVKTLWIDFFSNENEVQKLESWLKWVKQKLSVYTCTSEWNPFSIEWISHKLRFKREWNGWKWITETFFPEDILKEFPTLKLSGNEKLFLQAMNNPDNKMRGTAVSS